MTYAYSNNRITKKQINIDALNVLALGLGLFSKISFRLVGIVYVSELLCFALLPFAIFSINLNHRLKKLLIFLGIWVFGSYLSNIYNNVSLTDNVKGVVSKLFLFAIIPVLIWLLQNKPARIMYFAIGHAISALLSLYVLPSNVVTEFEIAGTDVIIYYWFPIITATAGVLYYFKWEKTAIIFLATGGVASLFWMSRNLFLSSTIAIMLTVTFRYFYVRRHNNKNSRYVIITLAAIAIIGGLFIAKSTYSEMATGGELGENAQKKFVAQNSEKMGLLSGRADFFMALSAIYEKPFWGYGDYAKDKQNIRSYFTKKYLNYSYYTMHKTTDKPVPGHSHILGAWVYNGILSLPFWAYIFYISLLFALKCLHRTKRLLLYASFLFASTMFNLLFSPFNDRFEMIVFIFFALSLTTEEQKTQKTFSKSIISRKQNHAQ